MVEDGGFRDPNVPTPVRTRWCESTEEMGYFRISNRISKVLFGEEGTSGGEILVRGEGRVREKLLR